MDKSEQIVERWRIDTLKSIFSENKKLRATGRTTLLAKCFIELAIASGEPIRVFDHYNVGSRESMGVIHQAIQQQFQLYAQEYKKENLHLVMTSLTRDHIKLELKAITEKQEV